MSKEMKPIEKTGLDVEDMEEVFKSILMTKGVGYRQLREMKILPTNLNAKKEIQTLLSRRTGKIAKIGEKVGVDTEFLSIK